MSFFDTFEEEYDVIRELLIVLTVICNSISAGRPVELYHLDKLNDFIFLFIDKYHHRKQEYLLLPAMEVAGFPRYGGMPAISLDHEKSCQYLEGMHQSFRSLPAGGPGRLGEFCRKWPKVY